MERGNRWLELSGWGERWRKRRQVEEEKEEENEAGGGREGGGKLGRWRDDISRIQVERGNR